MSTTSHVSGRDDLYEAAASEHGAALGRLAYAYEADPEKRRDLLQEIHLALWRSFEGFNGRCSVRTWVYRVAHNTAISWVMQQKRGNALVALEMLDEPVSPPDADRLVALDRLHSLIQRLKPLDRAVMVGYLEGCDAAEIAELTGLSAANAATKVHRIKRVLAREFNAGGSHVE